MKMAKTPSRTTTITDATRLTNVAPTMLIAAIATITSDVKTLSQPLQASSPTNSEVA